MKIYVDMDMVLCDFLGAAEKVLGKPFADMPKEERSSIISAKKDFWHTLPWYDGGKDLWKKLTKSNDDVYILSAFASWDPNCKPGKKEWIKKNLRPAPSKIYLVKRDQKKNFADKDSILIDDHIKNIKEWESVGGKAVHHINRSTTLAKLKKLGLI
jgi:hypothetical protein